MAKKGLSEVVSVVIFIVLVLAIILILYIYLRPATESGVEQLDPAANCLKMQIEPVECVYSTHCPTDDERAVLLQIKSRRNAASGPLTDMRFVFTAANGETIVEDYTNATYLRAPRLPTENEFTLNGFAFTDFIPTIATVTPVIGDSKYVCPPLKSPIKCKLAEPRVANKCADCDQSYSVNAIDYTCYLNSYAAAASQPNPGNSYADFTGDGRLDVADAIAFCLAVQVPDCSSCNSLFGTSCYQNNQCVRSATCAP